MPTKDLVIAIAGAALILTVLAGVFVIESREGAREHELESVSHPVRLVGDYSGEPATGSQGPGGTCVPEVGETECTQPHFRMDLQIDGLPPLSGQAHYVAFLVGQEDVVLLGALQENAGSHSLAVDEELDVSPYDTLEIWIEPDADPQAPRGLLVYSRVIDAQEASLMEDTRIRLPSVSGWVRTSQTGAVTVSALVEAELEEPPELAGWTLHAWFLDGSSPPVVTHLGPFEPSPGGSSTLDVRHERVRVEDQVRFLVTLEPDADPEETPQGFPAYESLLREDRD